MTAETSTAPHTVAHPKGIRSFVKRAGRLTTGQERALHTLGPRYALPFAESVPAWDTVFGRQAPRILEIGFGMGESTAHIAQVRPQDDFIACEVHEPGVGALLMRIEAQQLGNLRIVAHDAVEVLQHMIAPNSLAGVHIFFPDPWHKKRHNKRRLVQPPLVAQLVSRLQTGGYIHMATDWQPYAEQMLEVLMANPDLVNTSSHSHGYADQPAYRPLTKFENRGIKLGHGVWDLVFQRR